MKFAASLFASCSLFCQIVAAQTAGEAARPWPHPIPCRVQDGTNPDLFVMTLGAVESSISDGVFDPVKDEVTLKDGSVRKNYYRDVLGVKNYQPLDKSRFPVPPSGWCTWYFYYSRLNEAEVRRNAEWIAANLKDYGARYVQIDDGWQGTGARGSARNWAAINSQRFPNGLSKLAAHIKSLGLTPGIWLAPHGQNNEEVVSNHPNVFLRKADGSLDEVTNRWEGRFLVDPSTPESLKYEEDLFKKLSGWGYEYFKIDGQPLVVDEYRNKRQFMKNPADDVVGLYRQTIESIRAGIGPDRYLLGCWGIPLEGAGIMNGSRTGGDIVLGWGGFQVSLRPTLQYYYLHNIVWYSDPDVLLVRSPLTLDQARVWATLQGLTGQALMSSDRLMDLGEDRVELLRRVYPACDIRPLDLFPTERYKRIWDLKVNHLGRNYDVVGVFNFNQGRAERTYLRWTDLGLPAGKRVHVFDFWNKEYLGSWAEGMIVDAAPTSCRVLTLLPEEDRIQLISTSRHITQGWVDLVEWKSEVRSPKSEIFSGVSKVVKNDPYELRFAFPRGTNFVAKRAVARAGLSRLPVKISNHQGWAAVEITSPKTTEVKWEVEFEPGDYYHFPPSAPENLFVERAGLDGVNLNWREQYYLNAGYQVYLDGALLGYTPAVGFPIRGLNPLTNHVAEIKAVWEDGTESVRASRIQFSLVELMPNEISLTQLEPVRSTGRWRGFEIEELLSGAPLSLGGKRYEKGLGAFASSEIEFDLKGLYGTFTALAGVDDSSGGDSTVEFLVIGDGRELWRSGPLRKSDAARRVEVSIAGVRQLILRSVSAGDGERRNRPQADWVEPRITK
jgi:hypothetical protein